MMKNIDITHVIVEGEIDKVITCLTQLKSIGYDSIYFDGYEASIEVYQSHQPERLNPENVNNDVCDSLNSDNK
jgi:hypothetical protein